MRVLHIGKYLAPHPGGIERFLAELMPAQRRAGIRAAALVHGDAADVGPACRYQSRALTVRVPVLATIAYTPLSPTLACRLDRVIRRWRPDVLHLHLPNPSTFWALLLPSARRLPWVVHWHADVPADAIDGWLRLLYRLYRPMETAVLRRASAIVATSDAYAASSEPLSSWRDKVSVVPLGLADQARAPPAPDRWPPGTRHRLLFVGRFSYYKGLDHLIDALRLLPPDSGLLLVGSGELRPSIEQRVTSLGLSDRVRFAGALDDAALAGAYAAADVVCLPSIERSEAFGMVLLEAMRAGVPCIATAVSGSGMAEVVGNDVAGLIAAPGDAASLTQVIGRLRNEAGLSGRLGEAGRARFLARFQIDRVAAMISGVYRSAQKPKR